MTQETIETIITPNTDMPAEQYQALIDRLIDMEISLEVANERWIKAVNENAALELENRKLKRNTK